MCAGSSFCRVVTKGYYFVNATHEPRACPAGAYTDKDGAKNCSACPAGFTSTEAAAADGCRRCGAGQYASARGAATCTEVPAGYAFNRTVTHARTPWARSV